MRIKISYSRPHPGRPQWPIPRYRLVYFGLVLIGSMSGLVGAVEYEAGDHRFRLLRWGGLALLFGWLAPAAFCVGSYSTMVTRIAALEAIEKEQNQSTESITPRAKGCGGQD